MDLVVTVPKDFWFEWIDEGDPAGKTLPSGIEWGFWLGSQRPPIEPGDRLYVVAWNMVRGFAPVTRVAQNNGRWVICREGGAVACTVPELQVPGFRGWRKRWWEREREQPFEDWRYAGVPQRVLERALRDGFLPSETAP
jgi:hypothetical protein